MSSLLCTHSLQEIYCQTLIHIVRIAAIDYVSKQILKHSVNKLPSATLDSKMRVHTCTMYSRAVCILNVSNAYNAKLGIYTANSYQQLQKLTPRNVKYTIYQWQTLIWVHVENLTCRTGTC